MSDEQQPYVPAESTMAELTVKAVVLGVVLAAIMGAANAYLALKAGQTVSATFPAAILALAAFRLPFFRGTILEQNVARAAGARSSASSNASARSRSSRASSAASAASRSSVSARG